MSKYNCFPNVFFSKNYWEYTTMCVSYILKDQFLLYLFIYSCSSQNSSISLIALKKKGLHAGHKTLQLYALIMQLFFLLDSALPSEFLPRIVVYDLKGFQPNLGSIIIVSEAFVFTSLSFIQAKVLVFSCFFFFCHKSNTILVVW